MTTLFAELWLVKAQSAARTQPPAGAAPPVDRRAAHRRSSELAAGEAGSPARLCHVNVTMAVS